MNEKELVSLVDKRSKDGEHEALDMQNYINLAYYVGQQWISMDNVSKQLYVPPKGKNEIRYVANKIQPIVRTELAKMTKNKPICDVIPATSDDDDIQSAHTGQKVCEAMEFQLDLPQADKELILFGLTGGISFIKPYWDGSLGDDAGQGLKTGDVNKDVLSAFEVKWDNAAKRWEDVQWVLQEKSRTTEYVKKVYGKDVMPEKEVASSNIFESKLSSLSNFGTITYKKADNSVIVKEYWEKPSSDYPKGRRITVASGELLFYQEDIGFGDKDKTERVLPYFPFVHIDVPGRVAGQSVIENLIPIQRERNRSRSQIIKNKDLVGSPPWIAEEGSIINEIEGEEGEIVEYRVGSQPPHLAQPPGMGADVYRNIEQCDSELDFVSGQHEVSHGQTPQGITSGTAISFLQEQDDTKLGPSVNNFERCKAKYMSYILKIVKHKYVIERTLRYVGKNNGVEAVTFMGSDLTSTDVRVIPGSSLPTNKTAKQQFIMGLIEKGILDPKADKAMILKMLELGESNDLYDEYSIDYNHAVSEHEKWLKGDYSPIVRDFYNHDVHIKVHNKFRKSDDYEKMGDQERYIIDDHVAQHMQYMQQMQMQAIQQMQGNQNPIEGQQNPML